VLFFSPHIVKDDHLHVKAIVSLLNESLLIFLIDCCLDLLDQLVLY
jgi:hypothetical protein